ncbi:MAG: hypothetical protein J6A92_06110 [Lachnospiraceae bacterium]|nr:hypothetical protein [Lachnospiraceae bacterium]
MALTEKAKADWEKTLKELKLADENDEVEEQVMANYYEKLFIFKNQVKGNILFTRERFVFCSTFGINNVSIPYKDIKEVALCKVGLMPGFELTITDSKKNKDVRYMFALMHRDDWVDFIERKRNS